MPKRKAPKESVAMVGYSRPATPDDITRLMHAMDVCGGLWPSKCKLDFINLEENGRDFLTNTECWDVVMLHSIFYTNAYDMVYALKNPKLARQISPLHSVENWIKRLESCGARLIVVCEFIPCSLSGWNLGELRGYTIKHRDHRLTVYVRVEQAANNAA